jgi:hypothetical protein
MIQNKTRRIFKKCDKHISHLMYVVLLPQGDDDYDDNYDDDIPNHHGRLQLMYIIVYYTARQVSFVNDRIMKFVFIK